MTCVKLPKEHRTVSVNRLGEMETQNIIPADQVFCFPKNSGFCVAVVVVANLYSIGRKMCFCGNIRQISTVATTDFHCAKDI